MFANANTSVRVLRRSVVNEEGARRAPYIMRIHFIYTYIHIGTYIYYLKGMGGGGGTFGNTQRLQSI